MASDIWLRTILIMRKETRCRHIGYSYRLTARVLLYAPTQGQDNTYHGLCYTSRGALAGTRNSSMVTNLYLKIIPLNGNIPSLKSNISPPPPHPPPSVSYLPALLSEGGKWVYLRMHSKQFNMVIWHQTIQIASVETCWRHYMGCFPISSKGSFICTISQTG